MNKKANCIILFCALLLTHSIVVKSQQQIQLTQNIFNILSYNPGYIGSRDAVNITGTFRNQWIGFKQTSISSSTSSSDNNTSSSNSSTTIAPSLYMISADLPIRMLKGGIGVNIVSDKIGAFNNITMNIGYAYQRVLLNGGKLGIGIELKLDNIVLDKSSLKPKEEDPLINNMEKNDFMADANIGVYYAIPNSYFAGFSIYNILQSQGKSTFYQEKRSYNLHGGYEWRLPAYPTIKFIPSVLIKTDFSSYQIDINALLKYKNKYWGGLNYRINDGLGIIFGLAWKDFYGSFSYDIPMSKLALGGSWGSFEAVLGYSFKFGMNKGKSTQKNTRYL